jgi:HSP20 family protein
MANLVRWEPFREMLNMRRDMDRLFDNFFEASPQTWEGQTNWQTNWGLAVDVSENEDSFIVKASVPGINPDDIEVTLTDNVLTIKGETRSDTESEKDKYHVRERRFGSFARTLSLPVPLKSDAIEATHENGVLTLTLPKAEEVKPRRISIKPQSGRRTIEG